MKIVIPFGEIRHSNVSELETLCKKLVGGVWGNIQMTGKEFIIETRGVLEAKIALKLVHDFQK